VASVHCAELCAHSSTQVRANHDMQMNKLAIAEHFPTDRHNLAYLK
jgi:hypothetical protein